MRSDRQAFLAPRLVSCRTDTSRTRVVSSIPRETLHQSEYTPLPGVVERGESLPEAGGSPQAQYRSTLRTIEQPASISTKLPSHTE